jgi:uncharacterized protein
MTDMETANRLYEAFEARDAETLAGLLHPDFRGDVTPGLPRGWGGVYDGPQAMLRDCWGSVVAELDSRPVPEDIVGTDDGRILVLGTYRGSARKSGREHEAVFAHVLTFRDGRIVALTQITDSRRWHEALAT